MAKEIKGGLKGVLECIPIILTLGILTGFGAYTTLFGALIISFVFLIFNLRLPFVYSITIPIAAAIGSMNVFLGGKSETLFSMLFISSIFMILFSLTGICKKTVLNVPRSVSAGFITGTAACGFLLALPLIFGQKTFSSVSLMFNSKEGLFSTVNEFSFITALSVAAIYHYLLKLKIKSLPCAFIAILAGALINFIFKMNLASIKCGFENFQTVANADFGNFTHLLLFGFLLSLVFTVQTLSNLKFLKKKTNEKKVLIISGISNLISSMTGTIAGTVSHPVKSDFSLPLIETVLLSVFVIFFEKISAFIPISAVSAILALNCYETIKYNFQSQKIKNNQAKIIFISCFLTCLYNIVLGIILSVILTLIIRTKKNDKKN